jgi:hypothetical protein
MEKLIAFIEGRYNMAYFWYKGDYARIDRLCSQAFGAVEFYHTANPDQFSEVEKLWNEWHAKFLALEMGEV